MEIVLRSAGPDDAPGIAAVHVETWQVAYAEILDRDFLARLSVHQRAASWTEILGALPDDQRVDVAVDGGRVVAFCHCGPTRDADTLGAGEVYAVYVAPSHWSHGLGSSLMTTAETALADAGHGEAVLWVLEANRSARRFYERRGWAPDGTIKAYESGTTALRYHRPLP